MLPKWLLLAIMGAFHLPFYPEANAKPQPSSVLQYSKILPSQDHKLSTLPIVLMSWNRADRMKDKMDMDKKLKLESREVKYDFIVVGSGTAGSIVAARLSDNGFSVLLLEAGGLPHSSHDNPAMSMVMSKHSETDWMYLSVEQNETCVLCPEKKYVFSAGKGLGGSANLNYLETLYEGAFQDYSEWMEITKDPNWGYYMLQPYFKTVKEFMKKKYPVSEGESQSYRSTFKALVRPSANLDIQKFSHVNKVIFDENGRAIGVEYEKHGSLNQAYAKKEIIMSAGVFGSPKVLMLSGIGPKELLTHYNITTRVDLPVGKNFIDHLAIPLGPFFRSKAPESAFKFLDYKSDSSDSWNSSSVLRMPLINLNYNLYSREMSHFLGINEGAFKLYMDTSSNKYEKLTGSDSMFINVALKKPVSRGEVTLSGKYPKLEPLVNPNYLNAIYHQDTLAYSSEKQRLMEALEETVRLMENNPTLKSKFTEVPFPGCEGYIFRGYGYWDCYIRHFSMSFNHGVGTCSMGASSYYPSVVNPELKVYGVSGLRIIDASVIPIIPGTYPFQSVAVVAERGVEMIIREHKSSRNSALMEVKTEPESSIFSDNESTPPPFIDNDPRRDVHTSSTIPPPPRTYDEPPFSGFRIKKLSLQALTTTSRPPQSKGNSSSFSLSKSWQNSDQIIKAYTHKIDSSLSEDDLMPPGEPASEKPNPSYYSVKPFGSLIFHPLIPQREIVTSSTTTTESSLFQFKFNF